MQSEFTAAYRAARRSYELGRLLTALQHSALAAIGVAAISAVLFGTRALVWIPVTLLTLAFTEWRGVLLMKGARRGLLAGVASMLVPLSILRPCCGIDAKAMGAACCVMPSACWAAGALVGLAMAMLLPKAPEGRRMEAAVGMILGVTSVAVLRCSMLFFGEAIGLMGGMAGGVVVMSLTQAWLGRAHPAA